VPSEIRDRLVDYFHEHGILLRRYFHPGCHRMEPYVSHEQYQGVDFPYTEKITSEIVVFPTGKQLTPVIVKEFSDLYSKFR
jgi:dTDP-4-amino-4,6-dideoxygalactose transaminase